MPDFPFRSTLSLQPLAAFWRRLAEDEHAPQAAFAREVTTRLETASDLLAPAPSPEVLARHADLVGLLMTAMLPPAYTVETAFSAAPPFQMEPFFTTPAYDALASLEERCFTCRLSVEEEALTQWKIAKAYSLLLRQCYGVEAPFDAPVLFSAVDPATGLASHHRMEPDVRFCEIVLHGPRPALSPETLQRLLADPLRIDAWTTALPPDLFEFRGVVTLRAVDVTEHEVRSALKNDLLQPDAMASADRLDHLQHQLRSLLGLPDLAVGLVAFTQRDGEALRHAQPQGRSLLLSDGSLPPCSRLGESLYAQAQARADEPLLVSDLTALETVTGLEQHLMDQGFRSVLLAPLRLDGRTVGLLELASPRPGALTTLTTLRLSQTIVLFATALQRSLDGHEDRVQAVIKQQYTAIHHVVEWRFREAAEAFMAAQAGGARPALEPIVFPDVYPLYGLSDVRDSSTHRAEAIRDDLVTQLGLALRVIVEAAAARPLPILDELAHRLHHAIDGLTDGPHTEDEVSVLEFLQEDVEHLFDHLAGFGPGVADRVAAYRLALDDALGIVYDRRRAFEQSLARINDTIGTYLDAQDQHAQRMFPHYFEKYKTDGVDYNVYVGASLLEHGRFDTLYLRNLRLWQLMVTCGIQWQLQAMRPTLPMDMETTHLLLVHSTPLAIRFRQDEKQFDVDGAYNIRYEIVKKRIDKARVKGTGERLTQPGRIAVVYTLPREAAEYRRYVAYLRAAGYFTGPVEELELEDLQGTHGLKALRVTVADPGPSFELEVVTDGLREARAILADAAAHAS